MEQKTVSPVSRVALARDIRRPGTRDYIAGLVEDFFEQRGDRCFGDDPALVCGIGRFRGRAVTIAGHCKGHSLDERKACNFGMPNPEGYRKFYRALEQAEKFRRPVLTFLDTPGANPGRGAEERGQGEAIARCLWQMSAMTVPTLCVVIGEGGSGGALALGVADRVLMLENAVYAVLSPEGFASILWKDAGRKAEAASLMKITAEDLLSAKMIHRIIPEPEGGAQAKPEAVIRRVGDVLWRELEELERMSTNKRLKERQQTYRRMGL